ncbi:crossover junction endodeoxyribonuclease RuvC [Candidatus Adlerbacteria bacterium RIFOXYC1_FULL_48_26]|uniref:Crossover junction endodeoxyribonuclease RuvC n=1 Tax=Candidatus Adlerbacteria bacterium RIFOXYC1_FULL_48_26 TaxID=1797247 RepID=A0A1F4Y438_9BACT|nr:MAG: crossover junction endodeoxyribonuclease RuvC [Candidatus Adlerbacteria bacterium RIFOXYC1_FULL_48_26]OGC94521.1 MAG: crossover junction endodeoxyribonuclease RuvC [Candidatus Adlerbacteria bacterium RIFOXYB1_FULL_48_10]OGC96196.1 MAG: crossover junction endodeoxyribonuclease RuvC [Candidatus Adlerbacteria bacterium RIFOXYD1_FULL_48_8]
MRVLAFDPGFERLGIAIVEKVGGKEVLLHSECVRTSAKLTFPQRLAELGVAVQATIDAWQPGCVAVESVFFEKNAKTAMDVAAVRGMLLYIASSVGLPAHEYTPLQVKVAITGYGKSDKAAIAAMIPRLVTIPEKKRLDDEMDAIAVGLTCLASNKFI